MVEKHKLNKESYIAMMAIALISLHVLWRFLIPSASIYPLLAVLFFGGIPLVFDLLKKMVSLNFGSDLLAGISIVTSFFLEEYLAGSLVVLMLSGGQALEGYALRSASRVLEVLANRAPSIAHLKNKDIPVEEIVIGDTILIFPHEICPVDGKVIEGNGVMDESYLTGEPFMIPKAPGANVLSGAINGETALTIEATKLSIDSRYAKIMEVMRETEQKRPHMRRLADKLGAIYTPLALFIALLAWVVSYEPLRFLAVLVIATPCPLLIAIPVCIIGSISACAKRSILIKNPLVLEQLEMCKTMIFDKTGTLTYGTPLLTEQLLFDQSNAKNILQLVASVERYSKHPLSKAILQEAEKENIPLLDAEKINEPQGEGLYGVIEGKEIIITSRKHLAKFKLDEQKIPQGEGLECVVLIDKKLTAFYRFRDAPRNDSISFIKHLLPKHSFKKLIIISGDRKEEVQYLADYVGISQVYAEKSPEEKVNIVVLETKQAKTAYLGDGINDAPALMAATVGIAFGSNSDITSEAAGAVIMESSLEKVDEFLHISIRMRRIALQSALGGMALSIIGMVFAAWGFLPPVAGAISQEVIDVLAVMNALRTIRLPKKITDM
jgi:heavy metal translocating P-type ATPase